MQKQKDGQQHEIQADENGFLTLKGSHIRGEHGRVGKQSLQHEQSSYATSRRRRLFLHQYTEIGLASAGEITVHVTQITTGQEFLQVEFRILYGNRTEP